MVDQHTTLEFLATYPRYGDPDLEFMTRILQHGVDEEVFDSFDVIHRFMDNYGIEIFTFVVRRQLTEESPMSTANLDQVRRSLMQDDLCRLFRDEDVVVKAVRTMDEEMDA